MRRSLRFLYDRWPIAALALVFSLKAPPVAAGASAGVRPVELRVEWLGRAFGVEKAHPRLSWRLESDVRGAAQTAYRVIVSTSAEAARGGEGDLWDSGKVASDETLGILYAGKALESGQECFWRVQCWDRSGEASGWSEAGRWSMGLLRAEDWKAEWISRREPRAVHTNRNELLLPPARHFRKEFGVQRSLRRATAYVSALGICDVEINGRKVGDAYFEPGWSDYLQRAYYRVHDVTGMIQPGPNAIGAVVADGWYAGYVGYGLLVGYGPHRTGRSFYGKTPALRIQLEMEFSDGSRELVTTDRTWKTTDQGPFREADLIMGESYDARREMPGWSRAGFNEAGWEAAIPARENGSARAVFSDTQGDRDVELGFQAPPVMQSYGAPPIRVTEELPARKLTEILPGVYIFDFGQNFAGAIRLRAKGPAGRRVRIRYGEMVHPDGRLMTENLRRARATDDFTLRGDPRGETWSPRFTYHGFQFVELTGLAEKPALEDVTGLVLHNDTPAVGRFECSDEVMTRFWKNATWTQRANFVELPTDCPQRDERLGWMGDAQIYVRTASFNADVAAFFGKWLDDVREAQLGFGAYPDYCPYPMSHGEPRKSFGTAWTDAGVICPWTIWQVYGDTGVLERQWDSLTRFMQFRVATSSGNLGVSIGNPWGDWLNVGEDTPIDYIDSCYFAHSTRLMREMAEALGRKTEASNFRRLEGDIKAAFVKKYLNADGAPTVDTQTAHVLALAFGLVPESQRRACGRRLAAKIERNGFHMATGFLGTKHLLPALSEAGEHDLAVRLFQSREFPSWGYEVVNGATTVWERWDSYTQQDGFGRHNAAMNSFSHYSFGAVCEWAFRNLAGIDTSGPGYKRITIRPGPPSAGSAGGAGQTRPIDWVNCDYTSARGLISSRWKVEGGRFHLRVEVPPNTRAVVHMPASDPARVTEGGHALSPASGVQFLRMEGDRALLEIGGGRYEFAAE
ncbi:MAG: family 78 glycoside hydrolase catalytic domain [Verrucomicrobia bacterium]|nr:family 78 glycoside hydrolase catalytic domain [Verrucomicrobiota bacterium]